MKHYIDLCSCTFWRYL